MAARLSVAACIVAATVLASCERPAPAGISPGAALTNAVARTVTREDGHGRSSGASAELHAALSRALAGLPEHGGPGEVAGSGARCFFRCSPPVGSVTSVPQVVTVPSGGMGTATLHWRWDQSRTGQVARHGCLWVSGAGETDAQMIQCERAGHTYATTVTWLGVGTYTFRIAPWQPEGPFTRPIEGIYQLAQATVIGVVP
jgi:hypothetical protein